MKIINGLLLAGLLSISANTAGLIAKGAHQAKTNAVNMSGSGTKEDPYQIATKADLFEFHDIVEGINGKTQNTYACAIMTDNVDLIGEEWEAIGNRKSDNEILYQGIFDGRNHTIDNLSMTVLSPNGMGLFAYTGSDSIIRNLSIFGEINAGNQVSNLGAFAGFSTGRFYNCSNYANVSGYTCVGGIVGCAGLLGENHGTVRIEKCMNAGTITGRMIGIGGIFGSAFSGNDAIIKNCYNEGLIDANGAMDVGGIAGGATSISYCHNVGEIQNSESNGIAGYVEDVNNVVHCYYIDDTDYGVGSLEDVVGKFEALTANQMTVQSNFVDWDFVEVWKPTVIYPAFNYTEFGLYVGSEHVNSGKTSGDGWSYEYWSHTLTLDGFTGEGAGHTSTVTGANGYITNDSERPLNLVLINDNSITNTAEEIFASGILSNGDLNISGEGSLSVLATKSTASSYGIECRSTMTIDSGVINAFGGPTTGYNDSIGIHASDTIVMNGGKLTAIGGETENGGSVGIYYNTNGIVIGENVKSVIGCGNSFGIKCNVKTALAGSGYTNSMGTEGKTTLAVGEHEWSNLLNYKYIKFSGVTVEDVIALINEIGTVEYTDACKAKIDAARDGYDALEDSDQALVTNYSTLTDAEDAYAALKADHDAADAVIALINAIPTPVTFESEDEITAAREAYDNLTDTQKGYVTNLSNLVSAEADLKALKDQQAADAVKALINAIPTNVDLDSEDEITAAREAYNALTDDQKALVDNYSKLTSAENILQGLKDQQAADAVIALINGIGTMEYSQACKDKIDAAREAYNALTDAQKALVNNYNTLTHDEEVYEHVDNFVKLVEGIGDVTSASGKQIKEARDAYDALTDEEKELVPEWHDELVEMTDKYEQIIHDQQVVTTGVTIGVIGGVLLLLVCGWALMMFVFNKWIRAKEKAIRAFPLFGLKKKGKLIVLVFPFLFVLKDENEIFSTKEDALKW